MGYRGRSLAGGQFTLFFELGSAMSSTDMEADENPLEAGSPTSPPFTWKGVRGKIRYFQAKCLDYSHLKGIALGWGSSLLLLLVRLPASCFIARKPYLPSNGNKCLCMPINPDTKKGTSLPVFIQDVSAEIY
jgi:hypothetical protein